MQFVVVHNILCSQIVFQNFACLDTYISFIFVPFNQIISNLITFVIQLYLKIHYIFWLSMSLRTF